MARWFKLSNRTLLITTPLIWSVVALPQQPVTSRGDKDQTVGTNNGLLIQQNIQIVEPVRRELISASKSASLSDQGWLSILTPGHQANPATACKEMIADLAPGISKRALTVELGPTSVLCVTDKCVILSDETSSESSPILSVERRGSSLVVNATVFGPDGDILAVIDKNQPHINKNRLFGWSRPNAHELDLVDNHNNNALHIEFINSNSLRVKGTFFGRNRTGVRFDDKTRIELDGTATLGEKVSGPACSLQGSNQAAYVLHASTPNGVGAAQQATPTIQNGIGIFGGNVSNPTVNNVYGVRRPPPPIKWTAEIQKQRMIDKYPTWLASRVPPDQREALENPHYKIQVTLGGKFVSPAFAVQCDKPCEVVFNSILFVGENSFSYSSGVLTFKDPKITGFAFEEPKILPEGLVMSFEVQSSQPEDFKVLAVVGIPYPE